MDTVHYVQKGIALCAEPDARWCTILRDAVTCAECLRRLHQRERAAERAPTADALKLG